MAWINLFNLPLPAIKEMFEIMNKRSDEIQITLKNSDTLEAEKYFDIPSNEWSLEGSMEALDRAEQLCLRMVEEITLTPGMAVGQDSDFPETLRSAEEGDAIAQYNLALMYDNGEGVPEDDAEAVKWYQLAAEQGAASAQYNLALMYATGEGVPEDDAEAVKWYQLAAEQGDAQAQTNLGVMYATGEGVPINYVTAYAWMNIAADSGHEDSIELRSIVEKRMTPSQISEAQKLSTEIFERIQGNQ
jgi:hypothetical protein